MVARTDVVRAAVVRVGDHRHGLLALNDALIWVAAVLFTDLLRFDFDTSQVDWSGALVAGCVAGVLQVHHRRRPSAVLRPAPLGLTR